MYVVAQGCHVLYSFVTTDTSQTHNITQHMCADQAITLEQGGHVFVCFRESIDRNVTVLPQMLNDE